MHSNEALPVIIVSANNNISASKIVSDLIEEEIPSDSVVNYGESRIWCLVNKYYRADVRLQPLADGEPPPMQFADLVEAHIIYLKTGENEETAERRVVEAGELSRGSHVRLVLTEDAECPALAAWACHRRYELVALQTPAPDEDDFADDIQGIARARAALHAHTWRGLTRLDKPNAPLPPLEDTFDSEGDSCDSWGSWQGEVGQVGEGSEGLEAGAQLGQLLQLVQGARREALAPQPDALRRRRAEDLLAAVRAALAPPDARRPL